MFGLTTAEMQFINSIMNFFAIFIGAGITIYKINQVHTTVNSRMSELLDKTEQSAHAAGAAEEAVKTIVNGDKAKEHISDLVKNVSKTAKATGAVRQLPKGTKIK